jgi:hypothetical protein
MELREKNPITFGRSLKVERRCLGGDTDKPFLVLHFYGKRGSKKGEAIIPKIDSPLLHELLKFLVGETNEQSR